MARAQVVAEIAGKVWKIVAQAGAEVAAEDVVLILESMKMEIPVTAPAAGRVVELLVAEEEMVAEGQPVAVIERG
jgi:acetyl-CoA carboxylase biotin carboxyl carrier protein